MGQYDLAAKILLQTNALGLVRFLFPALELIGVIADDAVVATEPVETDKLLQVDVRDAGGAFRLHVEVQARWKADVPRRVHHVWSVAHHLHGRVESIVICLRPDPRQRRAPRGRYVVPGRATALVFEFPVVCLWRVAVEDLFAANDPGVLPLVPFAKGAERSHVKRALRAIARLRPRERAVGLSASLALLAGAIFREQQWLATMPTESDMRSNPTWDFFMGKVRELVRHEEAAKMVTVQLRTRLGGKAARYERRLSRASAKTIEKVVVKLVECKEDADLVKALDRLLPPQRRRRS